MSGLSAYDPGRVANAISALLKMAFGGVPETTPFEDLSEEEWREAYAFAARQGVLPVAYDGVMMLPEESRPPKSLMLEWGVNTSMSEDRYDQQLDAIEKLGALYAENGIETLLLKGYGLSFYYPVPQHRECGDIDVYLFGDFGRGDELAAKSGNKVKPAVGKHSSFAFEGVAVENHRIIVDEDRSRQTAAVEAVLEDMAGRRHLERIFAGKTPLWIPSPDFNAIYMVAHAGSHFLNGEMLSIRNLCDWAMFLRAEGKNIDRDFLEKTLKKSRLDTLCTLMTGFCEHWLGLEPQGLPVPDKETERKFDELIFRYRTLATPDETFFHRVRRIWGNSWRYREVMHTSFLSYLLYAFGKSMRARKQG